MAPKYFSEDPVETILATPTIMFTWQFKAGKASAVRIRLDAEKQNGNERNK